MATAAATETTTTANAVISEEKQACRFSSWYKCFRHLTMKSIVLPLPTPSFTSFVLSDGIQLPEGATTLSSLSRKTETDDDSWAEDGEDEDAKEDGENRKSRDDDDFDDDEPPTVYSFHQLNESIGKAIGELGGSAFPKLNWSAPRDARWISSTLKCQTPGDVYLLLKSSDFCLCDVETAGSDLELVLRKWIDIAPSLEFRCFVAHGTLVAISQRHDDQFFPHLLQDETELVSLIQDFFETKIRSSAFPLKSFVFDCYSWGDEIWLLDFNPWASKETDPLLFRWDELREMATQVAEDEEPKPRSREDDEVEDNEFPLVRLVQNENENQIHHDPLGSYRGPIDTVHLFSSHGGDGVGSGEGQVSFQEFMNLCERPTKR